MEGHSLSSPDMQFKFEGHIGHSKKKQTKPPKHIYPCISGFCCLWATPVWNSVWKRFIPLRYHNHFSSTTTVLSGGSLILFQPISYRCKAPFQSMYQWNSFPGFSPTNCKKGDSSPFSNKATIFKSSLSITMAVEPYMA